MSPRWVPGAALDLLASDPRPPRCVALTGVESVYRVRVGDYRVLYSIDDEIRIISVIRIGHRREVYR
ncbi:MAG TPA: type II toxin-antitoxin system RelE/ParE family toxin [Candidatus Nanopelagicales bacterium]|nr:type II toxin-antitoxin system RelE/ParE family toxin [Candidatus Nanopelagicales bacterium]